MRIKYQVYRSSNDFTITFILISANHTFFIAYDNYFKFRNFKLETYVGKLSRN